MNDFQEEGAAQTIAILRDEIITERGLIEDLRNQLFAALEENALLQGQLAHVEAELSVRW